MEHKINKQSLQRDHKVLKGQNFEIYIGILKETLIINTNISEY